MNHRVDMRHQQETRMTGEGKDLEQFGMENTLRRVLGYYDLGELMSVQRVGRGFVNENWIFETTHGRFFFKRRHPDLRNPEIVLAQHALVKHLKQSGFPAPVILPTAGGETLLVLDGEFYEIQEHIEGKPYEYTNPAHFQTAAVTLGHYHACVQSFEPQPLCDLGELYSPAILATNLTSLRKAWKLNRDPTLLQIVQQVECHAVDLATSFDAHEELPYLIIHGDYYSGNLLFEGDQIVGVVDYDKACWQPRVVELAEALIYFASSWPGHLKHLVYPSFLDWDKFMSFLRYYSYGADIDEKDSTGPAWLPQLDPGGDKAVSFKDIFLSEKEVCALPDYICCIWLSVSLKQLMEKDSRPAAASEVLREVLDLGDWAAANRQRMIATTCEAIGRPS